MHSLLRLCRLWQLLMLLLAPALTLAGGLNAQVNPVNGLPALSLRGASVMTSDYVFWGQAWRWSRVNLKATRTETLSYEFKGSIPDLGINLQGQMQPSNTANATPNTRLGWEWVLQADSARQNVIGGGISFRFNLGAARTYLGTPEVLPGGKGWRWGTPSSGRVEMRFEPAPASVYVEPNSGGAEIRVMFYKDQIRAGQIPLKAELSVSNGAQISPALKETLAPVSTQWASARRIYEGDWPVDMSFLNAADKPAGKSGFVRAQGENLLRGDGSPVRFWGTNLTSYALFQTPRAQVLEQAKRLAAMGYNLVRLHHHDSTWVQPNIFGNKSTNTTQIDENSAQKIDWWIKCLKEEGIYIWLDLNVGRHFTPADKIDGFDEIAKGQGRASSSGYAYVNPSIQARMAQFAQDYLTRRNTETGLRAVDDPAIAFVQLTNENDVTQHFGNSLLPDKQVPWHSERYMDAAKRFAQAKDLPADKVWRSWEHGPSKIFLNDLEQRFNASMTKQLRALGLKALISTTSTWGGAPVSSLPALSTGDVVDIHSYGDENWLLRDPAIAPNFMHWLHAGKVAGKPSTVSEWNVEAKEALDRQAAMIYAAGSASHQQVAAMLHFADSQGNFGWRGQSSPWESYADPLMALTLPQAALIFRRGLVAPARTHYLWAPSADALYNEAASPPLTAALRTAGELGRLSVALPATPALPWLRASPRLVGDKVLSSAASLLPANANQVVSDTGQLSRNWQNGTAMIKAPQAQALLGWTQHPENWDSGDLSAQLSTPLASVVAVSLDEQPLASSQDVLLVVCGRAETLNGQLPYQVETVAGTVRLRAEQARNVLAVRTDGSRQQFKAQPEKGWITLKLDQIPGDGALLLRLRGR